MEMPNQPLKTIFHRLSSEKPSRDNRSTCFGHLRPLSVYSRMITCVNGRVSPSSINQSWNSSNPFCNLKIEIVNNNAPTRHKRRLDDSCLDDTYETPYKKPCSPKAISPDLACVVDLCNPLPDVATVSPTTDPQKVQSSVKNTVKDEGTSDAVICVANSDHVQSGQAESRLGGAAAPGGPVSNESEAWSETLSHEPEKVSMDLGPVFDFDVDDIMCLSPIDSDRGSDEVIEAFVDSFNSFYGEDCTRNPSDSDTQQTKPFLAQSPTQDQVSGEGYEVGEREEGKGEEMVGEGEGNEEINHLEEEKGVSDEGYFSRSYLKALSAGMDLSQAVTPLQPHISSRPLFRGREVMQNLQMAVSDEGEPPCPPGFSNPNAGKAVVCHPHNSFTSEDLAYGLYGAPLVPVDGADEGLEGTAGDDWSIGAPILASSVCHIAPVEFNVGCEGNMVEGGGGGLDSVKECQVTLMAEEVTVETSYENTLPLQVQVRSMVLVPSMQQSSSKPSSPPEQKGSETRSVQKPSPENNVVKTTTRPVQKPSPGQNIIKNIIVHKPLPGQNVIKTTPVHKPSPGQNLIKTTPVHKPSPGQNLIKTTPVHKPSPGQNLIKTTPVHKPSPGQNLIKTTPVHKPSPGQNLIKTTPVHKPSPGQNLIKTTPVHKPSPGQNLIKTTPVHRPSPGQNLIKTTPVHKPSPGQNLIKTTPVHKPSPGQNLIKTTPVHKPSPGQNLIKTTPVHKPSPGQNLIKTTPVHKPSPGQNLIKTTPVHKPSPEQNLIKTTPVHKPSPGQNLIKTTPVHKPSPEQNLIKTTPVHKPSPEQNVTKLKLVQASSTSSDQKVVKTRPVQKTAPRPVIYDREEDWQREKRLYVDSVTRHIRENLGAGEGVMTELLNLMNHVADQGPGTNGRQWQHPSDLTHRNYQRRFGNDRTKYTLDQWQNQNYRNQRRFAKVPQIFERSPVL